MEHIAKVHIEKLPEGYFLATSDDIQGLVAQGRTEGIPGTLYLILSDVPKIQGCRML